MYLGNTGKYVNSEQINYITQQLLCISELIKCLQNRSDIECISLDWKQMKSSYSGEICVPTLKITYKD